MYFLTHFKNKHQARGVTLLEVMISSALLITGVTAVTMVLGASNLLAVKQSRLTRGLQLAETVMEELLLLDADDLELSPGEHVFCYDKKHRRVDNCTAYSGGKQPDIFKAVWTSQLNRPTVGTRYLRLQINWVENWGEKRITFHTYRN
jgi:Tfp pilus assembly protein PilV